MSESTKSKQMSFSVLEDGTIRADFGPGLDPLSFHPGTLPESLYPSMLAKGAMAFLLTRTSKLTGDTRTPASLRGVIAQGIEDLKQGIWVRERQPGVPGAGEFSAEAEAAHRFRIARAKAKGEVYEGTLEQSAAAFAALPDGLAKDPAHGNGPTPKSKAALKALPRYQAAYAEVKAERQAAKAAKLATKAAGDDDDAF